MGWVATSEMQAAEAGRGVLMAGGTACDAAIAMAAALTVTEPTSNGLGGDLFALVHDGSDVHALAANGASPRALPVEALRRSIQGDHMPRRGWPTVTVPGQIAGWSALHERFGRTPWPEVLAPAIRLAEGGFLVGTITGAAWARAFSTHGFAEEPSWCDTFLVEGAPPSPGDRFVAPAHARTLRAIAEGGSAAFYSEVAEAIVAFSTETGGWFSRADFAAQHARWVAPLSVRYGGWRVYGMTAPTQGVCALEALGMLQGPDDGTPEHIHRAIEAIKLAFADTYATVADPDHLKVAPQALLTEAHLARRRARIGPQAGPSPAPPGIDGGTVLLCAVDDEGQAASVIQSNFAGFGSGLVVPGWGIALQNRGAGFSLDRAHPNALGAGKRAFHTILPGLVATEHGVGPFGCMGGQMQPQGHVQLVTALARGASPQAAVDAARWRWRDEGDVALEVGFPPEVARDLEARGHRLLRDVPSTDFGGAQILWPGPDGWRGGSDPRKDGGVLSG